MKKLLFLLSVLIFLATSCNNKATKKVAEVSDLDKLNGKWTMVSYSAFMPNIPSLADGDIIWRINRSKSEITVSMKNKTKTGNLGFEPGTYYYEVNKDKININGREYAYSFEADGNLKLDKNTDPSLSKDQPVMRFKMMR